MSNDVRQAGAYNPADTGSDKPQWRTYQCTACDDGTITVMGGFAKSGPCLLTEGEPTVWMAPICDADTIKCSTCRGPDEPFCVCATCMNDEAEQRRRRWVRADAARKGQVWSGSRWVAS